MECRGIDPIAFYPQVRQIEEGQAKCGAAEAL